MSIEKTKLDEIYNSLPEYFKKKMDHRILKNASSESREFHLLLYAAATEIAEVCKTPKKMMNFEKLDRDTQRKMLPRTASMYPYDSFSMACTEAVLYKKSQGNQFVRNLLAKCRGYEKLH